MAVLTRVAVCVAALMFTAACRTGQEQWGPLRGQVVDAETGKPIAGAHVMALWMREPPSLHYQQWVYDARETVTDADGRFEIPYERRWITAWVNPPRIDVFAPRYAPQDSAAKGNEREDAEISVVTMRPLKTRREECDREPVSPNASAHDHIPNYVAALNAYKTSLRCGDSL